MVMGWESYTKLRLSRYGSHTPLDAWGTHTQQQLEPDTKLYWIKYSWLLVVASFKLFTRGRNFWVLVDRMPPLSIPLKGGWLYPKRAGPVVSRLTRLKGLKGSRKEATSKTKLPLSERTGLSSRLKAAAKMIPPSLVSHLCSFKCIPSPATTHEPLGDLGSENYADPQSSILKYRKEQHYLSAYLDIY
jgi:hypothetical protein